MTLYVLPFGRNPNVNNLRVFGCRFWFTNLAGNQLKLDRHVI